MHYLYRVSQKGINCLAQLKKEHPRKYQRLLDDINAAINELESLRNTFKIADCIEDFQIRSKESPIDVEIKVTYSGLEYNLRR